MIRAIKLSKDEISSFANSKNYSAKLLLLRSQIPYINSLILKVGYKSYEEREDMFSNALETLWKFLDKYDPKIATLSTACRLPIKNAIINAKPNHKQIRSRIRKKTAINKLKKSNIPVTMENILSEVKKSHSVLTPNYTEYSPEQIRGISDEIPLENLFKDEEHEIVREELDKLDPFIRQIILYRLQGVSWVKIGFYMNSSRYKVQRRYEEIFPELKKRIIYKLSAK